MFWLCVAVVISCVFLLFFGTPQFINGATWIQDAYLKEFEAAKSPIQVLKLPSSSKMCGQDKGLFCGALFGMLIALVPTSSYVFEAEGNRPD